MEKDNKVKDSKNAKLFHGAKIIIIRRGLLGFYKGVVGTVIVDPITKHWDIYADGAVWSIEENNGEIIRLFNSNSWEGKTYSFVEILLTTNENREYVKKKYRLKIHFKFKFMKMPKIIRIIFWLTVIRFLYVITVPLSEALISLINK